MRCLSCLRVMHELRRGSGFPILRVVYACLDCRVITEVEHSADDELFKLEMKLAGRGFQKYAEKGSWKG